MKQTVFRVHPLFLVIQTKEYREKFNYYLWNQHKIVIRIAVAIAACIWISFLIVDNKELGSKLWELYVIRFGYPLVMVIGKLLLNN